MLEPLPPLPPAERSETQKVVQNGLFTDFRVFVGAARSRRRSAAAGGKREAEGFRGAVHAVIQTEYSPRLQAAGSIRVLSEHAAREHVALLRLSSGVTRRLTATQPAADLARLPCSASYMVRSVMW